MRSRSVGSLQRCDRSMYVQHAHTLGPLRLVAQDIGFSVRRQGFDSPRGCYEQLFGTVRNCGVRQNLGIRRGFLRFW